MDSVDLDVLDRAIAWSDEGARVALATVIRSWGSAPRPPGAWAAIRGDGALAGSVSGGCVEQDLIERICAGEFASDKPQLLDYGVSSEDASRFGLPCGGRLQLLIEPAPDPASLRELRRRVAGGVLTARCVDLASGVATLADALRGDTLACDEKRLRTIHGPRLRLLIIGACQIASYLVPIARTLDYEVTVCDPRAEYLATWRQQGLNADVVTIMPDDAVIDCKPDANTAIVALTHDPKLDDLALIEALRSEAFYVGALGSRANNAKRKARLAQYFALSDAELERLHGPVGLSIGSRTPPEIAVAIAAEMTAVRNRIAAAGERAASSCAAP
jgi:xanthine dehydrogenase accessory factor